MIFVDTGAFVAIYLRGDQYHSHAFPRWKQLLASGERLYTSNVVLEETITLIARRGGYEFALRKARLLYASPNLEILRPDRLVELEALDYFQKYADPKFRIEYVILVASQFGSSKVNVYGFGRMEGMNYDAETAPADGAAATVAPAELSH